MRIAGYIEEIVFTKIFNENCSGFELKFIVSKL